jgi:hypothetical protein
MTQKHTGRIGDTLNINVGGVDTPHYYGHVQVVKDPLALSASHCLGSEIPKGPS